MSEKITLRFWGGCMHGTTKTLLHTAPGVLRDFYRGKTPGAWWGSDSRLKEGVLPQFGWYKRMGPRDYVACELLGRLTPENQNLEFVQKQLGVRKIDFSCLDGGGWEYTVWYTFGRLGAGSGWHDSYAEAFADSLRYIEKLPFLPAETPEEVDAIPITTLPPESDCKDG